MLTKLGLSRTTSIFVLIDNKRWNEVKKRCRSNKINESQQINDAGWLPIHLACYKNAPLDVIEDLYNSYPDGVEKESFAGWLPIHIAIMERSSKEVVDFLHSITGSKQINPIGWNIRKTHMKSSINAAA